MKACFIERLSLHPCQISKSECVVLTPTSCDGTSLPLVAPAALSHPCQMCPHPIAGKNPELGEDPNFNQAPRPKETLLKTYKAVCLVLKGFGHTVLVGLCKGTNFSGAGAKIQSSVLRPAGRGTLFMDGLPYDATPNCLKQWWEVTGIRTRVEKFKKQNRCVLRT